MRLRVEYSTYFLFQVLLNSLSNRRSTCFRGIVAAVQHLGGMCCGSVMDNLKLRLRHEWHIRWPHLSLAVLREGRSSMQTTHSTLMSTVNYSPELCDGLGEDSHFDTSICGMMVMRV